MEQPTLNYDAHGVCQCESIAPHAEPLHGGILIALTHCQAERVETAISEYAVSKTNTGTPNALASAHALMLMHDVIETLLDADYHDTDYHEPMERSS